MTALNSRLKYLKDVLGIKSVIIPRDYFAQEPILSPKTLEFSFQISNAGSVLFLGRFEKETDKNFSVEELQLLEKIIVALKLKFEKTDIAKVKTTSRDELIRSLKMKSYSYVFLLGDDISELFKKNSQGNKSQFDEQSLRFFPTFHPQEMIQNPDLKRAAWNGFKSIMENLPR